MKSGRGQFPAAAERPDPKVRLYLFHGPDEANSRALGKRLQQAVGAEKQAFTGASLKSDPGALAAEAGAISMFGGRNLLWVEPAGEEVLPAVELVLDSAATDHPVVIIAGTLKKTSALLKAAEAHPLALSHASYVPEGRDAVQLVTDLGRARGLRIGPPAAAEVAARAGNDQAVIAQELTKFALYLNASPENPEELDDELLELLGAGASESSLTEAGDLALMGEVDLLAGELERLGTAGMEPIPAVRMLQRRLIMLAGLRARIDAGERPEQVLARTWKSDKRVAERALPRWSGPRLAQALDRVAQLERTLLLTPAPERAALGEELLQIARAARR